ncbi:MAG: substrate-binding domain-containing protein [Anaerocolumna sp.]
MNRKIICCMLAVILLILPCTGCSNKNSKENMKVEEEHALQIGFSFDSFVIERWIRDRDAFVMTANDLGAEVNVQVANGDVDTQISQIKYFIKKKMDVIVIVATDGDALKEVVKEAKEAGIKIVSYDRLIKNADTDLYISFDNEEVGREMANALTDSLPKGGEIYIISGPESDNNVDMIEEGFLDLINKSNLKVVYKNSCFNWNADLAAKYVEEALARYPDVKGIMCGNDDLASEIFLALSENRLAGKVCIVGQDADLTACQRIVEGTQTMTVFKQVEDLAKAAAYLTVALGKGEDITDARLNYSYCVKDTIDDGSYEIPYYKLECIPVTADNLDNVIIDSGFHTREDVYLNVE